MPLRPGTLRHERRGGPGGRGAGGSFVPGPGGKRALRVKVRSGSRGDEPLRASDPPPRPHPE